MAQTYVDPVGGQFWIPGAYPSIAVQPNNAGLSTTGVLVLVGEAESGPDFSQEDELADNAFGPDQVAEVQAKYSSGRLVDAFKAACAAAVDPDVTGAFTRAILVKTNVSAKASYDLNGAWTATDWCTLADKGYGATGNLIYFKNTISTETKPTTGPVTFIPSGGVTQIEFRANGDVPVQLAVPLPADSTPTAAVAAINAVAGVACTGGVDRVALALAANMTIVLDIVILTKATFTLDSAWATSVQVGDTLHIPAGSNFAGAGGVNKGAWVVLSVSGVNLVAQKLADGSTVPGFVPGVVTNPIAVGTGAVVAGDIKVYSPAVITLEAGNPIPGVGKTLQIAEVAVGGPLTDIASRLFYNLGVTPSTFVSVSGTPYVLTSAAEPETSLEANRQLDNVSEILEAGGEVALKMGYTGYSCTVEIDQSAGTFEIVYQATNPGAPVTLTLQLSSYPTVADLASYINSLPSFSAAPGTATLGNLPSTALDASTWGSWSATYSAANTWGGYTCRIKTDAYRFRQVMDTSTLVMLDGDLPYGGLPEIVSSFTYLAGGSKGSTTNTSFDDAILALEKLRCNFVIPLISRDATDDIADNLTDASSTYEIEYVNAAFKSHVAKMSTMKARRNRQAFLSFRGSFNDASDAAANIASFRCCMPFEDTKQGLSGSIVQYQPWMLAANAAAMQAGLFYKSLVNKQVNTSGVLQAAGDWTYNYDSDLEDALKAGLLPVKKSETGGFVWVSDQTTYGKDANTVYNSIQMVYAADTVALTTAQRMESAFLGKSLADVTAAQALSFLDGIMADMLRLKLIAPSSDAAQGYKNARVQISGPVMRVSLEVKIAGSIYFIPIAFYVTEITQTA